MLRITTLTTLRESFAAERAAARALGFTGDFKAACLQVLVTCDGEPTPFEWVRAAAAVRESLEPAPLDPGDDERGESGPGIDEPWEVAYGPRCW